MIKSARAGAGVVMPGRGPTGDPGLFGFLKGAVKTVGSFLTGGPVAAAGTAISQLRGGNGGRPPAPRQLTGRRPPLINPPFGGPPGVGFGGPVRVGVGERMAVNGAGQRMELACPGGFHPNKSDYFLKDGTFIPKGTKCVKNRRRNPMNPRALRRAVSRVEMGKRWQGKLREIETANFTKAGNRKD